MDKDKLISLLFDAVWVVRPEKTAEAQQLFESGAIALIDAGMGNLASLESDRDMFSAKYRKSHADDTNVSVKNIAGKYFRFVHEISVGEVVLYPATAEKTVYLGIVTGEYTYNRGHSLPHQRTVTWHCRIPTTSLSQPARYELGAARMLFQFKRHLTELHRLIRNL